MDLLKYLEPMKNLPERFSNLAFWRGVRKLRDEVVNAFEYVDSWGENIENDLANIKSVDYKRNAQLNLTVGDTTIPTTRYMVIDSKFVYISNIYNLQIGSKLPTNYGATMYISVSIEQDSMLTTECIGFVTPMVDRGLIEVVGNHLIGMIPGGSIDPSLPLTITSALIAYNPTL